MPRKSERITLTCSLNHEWIRDSSRAEAPCPFCTDRELLVGFNDLETKNPIVALDWAPSNVLKASEVSWKAGKYFDWLCHICSHEWSNVVRNIAFLGSKCPSCLDKEKYPETGFHIYRERIKSLWSVALNGELPVYIPRSSSTEFSFICKEPNHIFVCSLKSLLKTDFRCSICDGRQIIKGINDALTLHPELEESWSVKNKVSLSEVGLRKTEKYFWNCSKGHESFKTINRKIVKPGCEFCLNRKVTDETSFSVTHPNIAALWSDKNDRPADSVTAGSGYRAFWECKDYGHVWTKTIVKMTTENFDCPFCKGDRLLKGFNDAATLWPELKLLWSDQNESDVSYLSEVHKNSTIRYYWTCENGHETMAPCNQRASFNCRFCVRSKGETDLQKSLESLGFEVIESDRSIIKPFELDLVLPDYKVAIEFNGDYWHSDVHANKAGFESMSDYHLMKLHLAKDAGYKLLFVWGSQWKDSESNVVDLILKSLEGDPCEELLQLVSPYDLKYDSSRYLVSQ